MSNLGYVEVATHTFTVEADLSRGAEMFQAKHQDTSCEACWLGTTPRRCNMGNGPIPSKAMIVLSYADEQEVYRGAPGFGEGANFLFTLLAMMDIDPGQVYVTYAVKCTPDDRRPSNRKKLLKESVKECAHFLDAEIEAVNPDVILSVGAEAYYYFNHREGVASNRGKVLEWEHPNESTYQVVSTISPMAVKMNPKSHSSFVSDVKKWKQMIYGGAAAPQAHVIEVTTDDQLSEVFNHLTLASLEGKVLTFDLETRGFQSYRTNYSKVWCAAVTCGDRDEKNAMIVWMIPLEHPDSPWYDRPYDPGLRLCSLLLAPHAKLNGHNVKFDTRWLLAAQERWVMQ